MGCGASASSNLVREISAAKVGVDSVRIREMTETVDNRNIRKELDTPEPEVKRVRSQKQKEGQMVGAAAVQPVMFTPCIEEENEAARWLSEASASTVATEDSIQTVVKMKIGYIGSPGNLKDPNVKQVIIDVLSELASDGAEIYVGPPNAVLQETVRGKIQVQDMNEAGVDMFDAIIITPGGPGAEKEAKRFNTYTKLYNLSNSASEHGSPKWFSELVSAMTFDLKTLQVDRVKDAIFNGDRAFANDLELLVTDL